jgi:hypothetical protein
MFILAFVFRSSLRILRSRNDFDAMGVGLIVAWLAYLIQSSISINQIGLAIWGWSLGGAIVGYDLYKDRNSNKTNRFQEHKEKIQHIPANYVLTGAGSFLLGTILCIWPVIQDAKFRSALEGGNSKEIIAAADSYPNNNYYYYYAAGILLENNFYQDSANMAKEAITRNARDFNSWKLLSSNSALNQPERDRAIQEMLKLDPLNYSLKI